MRFLWRFFVGDRQANRTVPHIGVTARLTIFVAAVMAFLAVVTLAVSLSTGRMADLWAQDLAQSATLRLPADPQTAQSLLTAALMVLDTTPGVASARALSKEEQRKLLEPWFGADMPIETLPIPQLIEIVKDGDGYDVAGLQARLSAQVPGAVLDDHGAWRAPLVAVATRVRVIGWSVSVLIAGTMAAMITLAAQASLASNVQVIRVLRLVGAQDGYIVRAFVRRYTLRAGLGAACGTVLGVASIQALPQDTALGSVLMRVGFEGNDWLWPLCVPFMAAIVAFFATRRASFRRLKEQT